MYDVGGAFWVGVTVGLFLGTVITLRRKKEPSKPSCRSVWGNQRQPRSPKSKEHK